MKEFTLIKNDGQYLDLPQGFVVVFGNKRPTVAYLDYDGNTDRPVPDGVKGDWFPLSRDFDSINAWHGSRRPARANTEEVKIKWRKE